jgi:gliding motility-associated-like protein
LYKLIVILVLAFFTLTCRTQAQNIIDTVCTGSSDVPYSVDFHQGSVYKWTVEGGTIASGHGTNRITVNWKKQPGMFRLAVMEQNETKCWGDSVLAIVYVTGREFRTFFPPYACVDDTVTVQASGGLKYLWANGVTDSIVKFRISADTTLTVMISDTSCGLRQDTFSMNIKAVSKPQAGFKSEADEFYKNQPVYFSYSGNPDDKITWEINKTIKRHLTGHEVNFRFMDTGDAQIRLFSVNTLGCRDTATKIINVKEEQLFFPNAFTPNGDGVNDIFRPGGMGIRTYRMEIYDRWGKLIFQTTDMNHGWDGTLGGQPLPSDTYIYQCDARGHSGQLYTYTGNITILR